MLWKKEMLTQTTQKTGTFKGSSVRILMVQKEANLGFTATVTLFFGCNSSSALPDTQEILEFSGFWKQMEEF